MQLFSKAYLRVQEWQQMEMETVVFWLGLKEGSEKRGGIKGSKLQVEISTGLCPKIHRPCGGKTHMHTHANTFLTAPQLVFTVQLSMKRVSSQVEKKICPNASSGWPLHTKTECDSGHSSTSEMVFYNQSSQTFIFLSPHICH